MNKEEVRSIRSTSDPVNPRMILALATMHEMMTKPLLFAAALRLGLVTGVSLQSGRRCRLAR